MPEATLISIIFPFFSGNFSFYRGAQYNIIFFLGDSVGDMEF